MTPLKSESRDINARREFPTHTRQENVTRFKTERPTIHWGLIEDPPSLTVCGAHKHPLNISCHWGEWEHGGQTRMGVFCFHPKTSSATSSCVTLRHVA